MEVKEYLFTAVISGIVAIFVALPFIMLYESDFFEILPKAFITGTLIGIISRTIFMLVFKNIRSHPFWAFLSIFFIMGTGTFLSSYFFGLTNLLHMFLIVGLAEAVGLLAAYFIYHYSLNLNRKLLEKQERIKKESNLNP